ncbi:unnamed protein product, partial [Adineta steineri]
MNVTVQDLIKWSASFDLIENYHEYLNTSKSIFSQQIFNNCSYQSFGSRCQYTNKYRKDFTDTVTTFFRDKQPRINDELFPIEFIYPICYTRLKCSHCLDWREICDGKIDCIMD